MGLGFSKDFVIFLVLAILISIGSQNWKNGLAFFGVYAVIKIIWKFLTGKRDEN